ncbi:MAG: transaldolase [Deltaproteobacteria bacterium]|nr:transaldolase [Deltaproteobacteria bacterium]
MPHQTGFEEAMAAPTLRVHIFSDGANLQDMLRARDSGIIRGFTTNPTLMAKAGLTDYRAFARQVLDAITDLPVSFEVFDDEFAEMERQAREIAGWGRNVNVKIPITNTRGESSIPLIRRLCDAGVKLNVTAILPKAQLDALHAVLRPDDDVILSIFAGRIADTGRDPVPLMRDAVAQFRDRPGARILWASPREVLNVFQADACGCHIITCTPDLMGKLALHGKDLAEYSLDTVKMFRNDAVKAGFRL